MLYSTIMVTGCGGDIGLGIGRILKMEHIADKIIGCDIHNDHPGRAIFDTCYVIPSADSEGYIDSIIEIFELEKVDLVIPASEFEIRQLNQHQFWNKKEIFVTANSEALQIGFDKLATINMLKRNGLLYPWTRYVQEDPVELPCIVKSRGGNGSKDVGIVTTENFDEIKKLRTNDIWQEYLLPDNEEYTCAVYRGFSRETRILIMKRKLIDGCTGKGKVIYNSVIEKLLLEVADALNLYGSINVQLRLTSRGPHIFEINPRFSSTVVFRHKMGFRDLLWSLESRSGRQESLYIKPKEKTKFYRTYNEIIIEE